jgi:hypothetical protein
VGVNLDLAGGIILVIVVVFALPGKVIWWLIISGFKSANRSAFFPGVCGKRTVFRQLHFPYFEAGLDYSRLLPFTSELELFENCYSSSNHLKGPFAWQMVEIP